MNRFYTILLFAVGLLKGTSQNWLGLPNLDLTGNIPPTYIDMIVPDPVHDKLIFSNKFIRYIDNKYVRGIWSWDGTMWDSLGKGINGLDLLNVSPNGTALCGIEYNGKLLVGGAFFSMGRVKTTSLALWDGSKWDTLPQSAFRHDKSTGIFGFLNANNLLYIYGCYDTIAGQKAQSLATYDGVSFTPVSLPLDDQFSYVNAMVQYKNEFYIGGNFDLSTDPTHVDILKYNGNSWVDVGGGLKGSLSVILSMAVYKDELYVAGYFDTQSGNAGNVIMKWDGTSWHDVGWGDMIYNGSIYKLLVYKNKLFAFGTFNYAANMEASRVAVFDGSQWCAYPDLIGGAIYSAAIYHDTVFVAGGFLAIGGDTTKRLVAKLINDDIYSNCKPLSLMKFGTVNESFKIFPNPVRDKLNLEFYQNETDLFRVEITNTLGQSVFALDKPGGERELDLSCLANGVYYIKVRTDSEQKVFKVAKE